ncbi:MAG: hypothetical protein ACK4TP_17990 [Hyphomicrobium sp.]|jgi:hypothetical protein
MAIDAPSAGLEFGTCCAELKDAMSGEEFEPLITVGDDGVLYMSVGLIDLEDEEPGMVDHPLFFCPFCGTKLQSVEDVRGKTGDNGADD